MQAQATTELIFYASFPTTIVSLFIKLRTLTTTQKIINNPPLDKLRLNSSYMYQKYNHANQGNMEEIKMNLIHGHINIFESIKLFRSAHQTSF